MTQKIGFIGTGLMGAPMVRNLLAAGFEVSVWNRTFTKAVALGADGATVCEDAAACIADADVVISMVSDGPTVRGLVADQAIRRALKASAVWVDMSSIKPAEAREHFDDLATLNVAALDAPVSGGTKGAEAGTLAIMVGGDAGALDSVQNVLSAMGRPVHVGGPGTGQLSKLANQAIVGATIGTVAEAMLMLERGGANPVAVRDALKDGFADSTILQQHGACMTDRDFEPGGLSSTQLKDMNNVLEEGADLNLTLPITQHIRDRYAHLVDDMDGAGLDHSALFLELLKRQEDTQ